VAVPADLARKHAITIDSTKVGSGGVSDFSVMITRDHLDDEVVDPSGSNAARTDGGDVRFSSDSAGTTQLACDVIAFEHDSSTGADDAEIQIRVNVPSLSSASDTDIYIWYDGSTTTAQPAASNTYGSDNAYDANWEGYWPDGGSTDRTSNGNDGTAQGGVTLGGSTGQVGDATDYEASSTQYSDLGTRIDVVSPMTLLAWVNPESLDVQYRGVIAARANADYQYQLRTVGATSPYDTLSLLTSGGSSTSSLTITSSTWQLIGVSADTTGWTFFKDSSTDSQSAQGSSSVAAAGNTTIGIGGKNIPSQSWDGLIDEAQIHSTARSSAWITTEYNNTNSPSTFASPGTPSDTSGGGTPIPVFVHHYRMMGAA
jgi:hypothetical protein